uniref:NADH-ubiquinone oxidoreductase chain 5 n=1 Tax=Megabalanus volcano TaxID=266495 RepID=Q65Z04_MEGVO|nr:NADH dehydrogenase subunit 5 [Megabalanus volcano]BAD44768.1 NADH dehydrogenase subunit 5 [Megabalanus volcano]
MFVISMWNLIFMLFFTFSFLLFFLAMLFLNFSFSIYLSWNIFSWGATDVNFIFLFDWVSLMFLAFVLFISGSVFYYSGEYMEGEINLSRFIFLLAGFVGSMGLLIFSPNLISILLGWDGLGLVSYCLVIYYQNYKSLNAGTLTVLSNRVGDVLILVGIVWMINFGDWSFTAWMGNSSSLILTSALIILASLTKSAQIPFSAWLPAAMAAPTPVSSLVHSSTLVTAGIYLVIRLGWVYDFWMNELLMILSVLTMFMAGLGACFEFDLKKIIALSTLSQLGLMMYSLSLGLVKVALFHLLMHALFKALLFMSAGCIIHGFKGWQDIRMMGNMMVSLPFISSCFVVSNLALSGMPFLAGFYSKDLILELSLMEELNFLSLFMLFLSTGLTVAYTFRLIYYMVRRDFVLSGSCNLSDGWGIMTKACMGLVMFSVFFGALISWLTMDISSIVLPKELKNLTLSVCLLGALIGFLMSQSAFSFSKAKFSLATWFSGSMWFLPYMSSQPMVLKPLTSGSEIMTLSDMGWLEFFGGQGIMKYINYMSLKIQLLSDNSIKMFILLIWIVLSMVLFFY